MTTLNTATMYQAGEFALHAWKNPHPDFTSGLDARSSDNALLVQLYGGLLHAHRYQWQNAGRRLIDKTYIKILLVTQSLTNLSFITPEGLSENLDGFIRDQIAPRWKEISDTGSEQTELANELFDRIRIDVFKCEESEVAASYLLFFLLPLLPVFPITKAQLVFLKREGLITNEGIGFPRFQQAMYRLMTENKENLDAAAGTPIAQFGSETQRRDIDQVLANSDWWPRRVTIAGIQKSTLKDYAYRHILLGCSKTGGFG